MSLRWDFNDKIGSCKMDNYLGEETEVNIYKGNAFMIACEEWTEDGKGFYNLAWFFVDKEHCKNCLGLTKGYDKIDYKWKSFKLNTAYKETEQFIQMLAKAKLPIKIELYHEERK